MAVVWYCFLAFSAFLFQPVLPGYLCGPSSVLPQYQPVLPSAVISAARKSEETSLEECSRLCCKEGCTVAYIRGKVCIRFTCGPKYKHKCSWKKSHHVTAIVIVPPPEDSEFLSCSLPTHTGCGEREVCSDYSACECQPPFQRSPGGLCSIVEASSPPPTSFFTAAPSADAQITEESSTSVASDAGALSDVAISVLTTSTSVASTSSQSVTSSTAADYFVRTSLATDRESHAGEATTAQVSGVVSPATPGVELANKTLISTNSSASVPTQGSHISFGSIQSSSSPIMPTEPTVAPVNATASVDTTPSLPQVSTSPQPSLNSPEPIPGHSLHVSAGDSRTTTLPDDEVTMYATIFPKPEDESGYEFQWTLLGGPSGGQIENPHAESARLFDLLAGVYRLHLKVTGPNGDVGEDSVNITVLPKPRLNKAPTARVMPQSLRVRYPQSSVVLDASQSSDDFDTELKYQWTEVIWPLGKHLTDYDSTRNSVLKLHDLKVGEYQLKLVVTDSNNAEGSALVNITVLEELDNPPRAIAGEPAVIQLPVSEVWLNGNKSTDDKGIVSYIWKKLKGPAGNDQSGSSSPYLHLSNLIAGDYLFQLTVKDRKDQSAISTVSVVVKPADEKPPHVEAGNDMESVARAMDLTGRAWMGDSEADGCLGCSFSWHILKSPSRDKARLHGNDSLTLHVEQMIPGQYIFQLTARSSQGKKSSDQMTLTIRNAADVNKAPVADAGRDVSIRLPNHMAMLDGSQSRDEDDEIVSWQWTRLEASPAVGDVANGSDYSALLKLANLVPGTYSFKLTVADTFGKMSSDVAKVLVLPAETSLREHLFEIEIKENASEFTENDKEILVTKVAMALGMSGEQNVLVYAIDSRLGRVSLVLHVADRRLNWTAKAAVKQLRSLQETLNLKVKQSTTITVQRINTFYCLDNCSNHGTCEPLSKQCICDTLWIENPFRARFGEKAPNCDWNLLYVAIVNMAFVGGVIGLVYCCMRAYQRCRKPKFHIKKQNRKRGYSLLKGPKSDEDTSIAMLPNVGYNGELRSHSDSEELLFDTSRFIAGVSEKQNGKKLQANGKHPQVSA